MPKESKLIWNGQDCIILSEFKTNHEKGVTLSRSFWIFVQLCRKHLNQLLKYAPKAKNGANSVITNHLPFAANWTS